MNTHRPWKALASAITNYWAVALSSLGYVLVMLSVLSYKLGTLVSSGFSASEISTRGAASSAMNLQADPLFGPHKGLQFILQHFKHYGPVAMRGVSVLFGVAIVISLYYVLIQWYTKRIAILGSLLLVTSSWFLHAARLATTDIMFALLVVLFACGLWLQQSRASRNSVITCGVVAALLLYTPGMIWFVLPAAVWQHKRIGRAINELAIWQILLLLVLGLGLLLPLGWGLATEPGLYSTWLGFPSHWGSISQIGRNLIGIPRQLFWQGPADPSRWLGRLPLLDWFTIVMLAIGIYSYWFKLHLDRAWFLIYVAAVGSILIAVGGSVKITLFLPFIYLVVASGIALMLQQWFTVFPRNPFARSLGTTLLVLAVLSSGFYQVKQYFIAWPHTPETRAVFQQRP